VGVAEILQCACMHKLGNRLTARWL